MKIQLHNSLSGKLEEFIPINQGKVGFYTCGPTVYDYAHIGNFRAFLFEDLLRRMFECSGYTVDHVMNITDVDDKTIAGAIRDHVSLDEYTKPFIEAFQQDLRCLNILEPNTAAGMPRATQEVPEMIEMVLGLIGKDKAYEKDGSVYYRTASFEDYGKLSKKILEKNMSGVRIDNDEYDKEQATDFVLWKKSKPGEPKWESPWGEGRPGWHLECSAMSMKYLGACFDLHAGGEDLIFPHHENEIAQSEGFSGKAPFVKYWMHCKFLLVDGEKMSKSKGNFYTLRDLLAKGYDPQVIRLALSSGHYRAPLNFSLKLLDEAKDSIRKLDEAWFRCLSIKALQLGASSMDEEEEGLSEITQLVEKMADAMRDDLNISKCIAELLQIVKAINRRLEAGPVSERYLNQAIEFFRLSDRLMGFQTTVVEEIPKSILETLVSRNECRAHPDFKTNKTIQAESDKLRDAIEGQGWRLRDARPGFPSTVAKKQRTWELV